MNEESHNSGESSRLIPDHITTMADRLSGNSPSTQAEAIGASSKSTAKATTDNRPRFGPGPTDKEIILHYGADKCGHIHDYKCERALLGCVFLDPGPTLSTIRNLDIPNHVDLFADKRHRIVYKLACAEHSRLYDKGSGLDLITFNSALKREVQAGRIDEGVISMTYVSDLQEDVPSVENASSYLGEVLDKYKARKMRQFMQRHWTGLNSDPNGAADADEELEQVLSELEKLRTLTTDRDPQPLPGLPPVKSFDPNSMLPPTLAAWVEDVSDRMQCPIDYPAVAIVTALSGVVMRRVGIRPKSSDNWTVVPNLWSLIVGSPGALKTPPVNAAMSFLEHIESYWNEEYLEELKDYKIKLRSFASGEKVYEARIKEAWSKGNKSLADQLSAELEADRPEEPTRKRLLIGDTTHQKLGMILQENPHGVLMRKDESRGWLKEMNREEFAEARSFFLTAWNGDGAVTFDRVGRGHTRIEGAAVSIIGNIQPGPLKSIVEAGSKDDGDDGFLSRFQLVVMPENYVSRKTVDRAPDVSIENKIHDLFHLIAISDGEGLGAQTEGVKIPFVRFKSDAQELFLRVYSELRSNAENEDLHPSLGSLLSKYPKLIPSLALLFSLADGKRGSVGIQYLEMALKWKDYLFSHAQRIYGAQSKVDEAVSSLAKKITAGLVQDRSTVRDIGRNGWAGLKDTKIIQQALDELEELQWIRTEKVPPRKEGGRPTVVVRINPKIQNTPQ